jgi:hypothetical protein
MAFAASDRGPFDARLIKFLRLGFDGHPPKVLSQVQGGGDLSGAAMPLVQTMLQTYIRT